MRQAPEYFGEQELELIYVAKKLADAQRLETVLDEAGLDYVVEPDQYKGGVIFSVMRVGAFFYVVVEQAERARELLRGARYKPYVAAE